MRMVFIWRVQSVGIYIYDNLTSRHRKCLIETFYVRLKKITMHVYVVETSFNVFIRQDLKKNKNIFNTKTIICCFLWRKKTFQHDQVTTKQCEPVIWI